MCNSTRMVACYDSQPHHAVLTLPPPVLQFFFLHHSALPPCSLSLVCTPLFQDQKLLYILAPYSCRSSVMELFFFSPIVALVLFLVPSLFSSPAVAVPLDSDIKRAKDVATSSFCQAGCWPVYFECRRVGCLPLIIERIERLTKAAASLSQ